MTAQQFAWKFEYPGRQAGHLGRLVLPLDRPVKLTLHSLDVIHSFWVPEFGQKSDAVPGIETTLVITPTQHRQVRDRLHRALRARPRDHARAGRGRRARRLREVPRERGGGRAADETSGEAVFTSAGCGGCHTFEPAGTDAQVGPDLDAIERAGGQPLEEFIRESIVDPNAVSPRATRPT